MFAYIVEHGFAQITESISNLSTFDECIQSCTTC